MGTCTVEMEHENNKKRCKYFVVPRNGQALLGMPDIDMPNIININIHSIGTEQAEMVIIAAQTSPLPREKTQSRKQTELRNAIQTQTAFQNLTTKISKQSITNYLTQ